MMRILWAILTWLALAGAALAGDSQISAPVPTIMPSKTFFPLSYQPGTLTTISATKDVFITVPNAATVTGIYGSASVFTTVTTNPVVTMFDCHADTTCSSGVTTIGTVTITAAGQQFTGTISNGAVAAGDIVGWAITAGAAAAVNLSANAILQFN